jgi:hypothetical protein
MPWKIPDSISADVLFDFREEVEERLLEALSESIYEQGLQLDVLTHVRGCDVKRAVLEGLNRYKQSVAYQAREDKKAAKKWLKEHPQLDK